MVADLFIQGRRVIHRHAELLVTENRIVWERVAPSEAVCVAVPSGDVDLADAREVREAVQTYRQCRVGKTVGIVTKAPADGVLSPVNGARRRRLVRKAEELSGNGRHQVAAAHYVATGFGLLARRELEAAAALFDRQGEADRAERRRDEAAAIWSGRSGSATSVSPASASTASTSRRGGWPTTTSPASRRCWCRATGSRRDPILEWGGSSAGEAGATGLGAWLQKPSAPASRASNLIAGSAFSASNRCAATCGPHMARASVGYEVGSGGRRPPSRFAVHGAARPRVRQWSGFREERFRRTRCVPWPAVRRHGAAGSGDVQALAEHGGGYTTSEG